MANNPNAAANLKSFKKSDPRINRKGRPKSFDGYRELAQQIAHEAAQGKEGDVVINGKKVTIAEAIMRQWAGSGNFQKQRQFMEVAFGKVPDEVNLKTEGSILITTIADSKLIDELRNQ